MDGSGRVTLKNRKFLKLATHHKLHGATQYNPSRVSDQPPIQVQASPDAPEPAILVPPAKQCIGPGKCGQNNCIPLPIITEESHTVPVKEPPLQVNLSSPERLPETSYCDMPKRSSSNVTPMKKSALNRELNRLGNYNEPGLLETKQPLARTRSGKTPY